MVKSLPAMQEIQVQSLGGEDPLEKEMDGKEIQTVHSKVDQSWVFTGKTDAEAETWKRL